MKKETQEIKIKYRISGIQPYPERNSHVTILLSPIKKLEFGIPNEPKIQMMSPTGFPIDGKQLQQMMTMIVGGPNSPFRKKEEEDPRNIIFVDSVLDFKQRGWKYLDVIEVAFNKVQDGGDITEDFLETE